MSRTRPPPQFNLTTSFNATANATTTTFVPVPTPPITVVLNGTSRQGVWDTLVGPNTPWSNIVERFYWGRNGTSIFEASKLSSVDVGDVLPGLRFRFLQGFNEYTEEQLHR